MFAVGAINGARAGELNLRRANTPPKIDGGLDDACWQDPAVIDQLHILETPGKASPDHKIRVTFDDQWLYAAYDIHQPEAQRQAPVFTRHDDFVQREDCVKLSFDPGTAGAVYYHFKLNRANARREQKVLRNQGAVKGRHEVETWNIPWRSAVRDNQDGWTAEIAVPLALLTPAGKLAKAKINLLATRYVVVTRDVAVNIATTERESLSAAPLKTSFDEPEHFIPVKGMEKLKVSSTFLPYVEKFRVSPYSGEAGNYFYDVAFDLKQFGKAAGKVKLEYEDRPADGQPRITERTVNLVGTPGTTAITMAIPADGFAARTGQLRLRDAATGELWQSEPLADDDMAALNTLFSAYLDRSYYTDEKQVRVICQIGLPEASLKDMKLVAKTCSEGFQPSHTGSNCSATVAAGGLSGVVQRTKQDDRGSAGTGTDFTSKNANDSDQNCILAESGQSPKSVWNWCRELFGRPLPTSLQAESQLHIPLASVALGATTITVQLLRADNTRMFTQTLELTKRPPNPGCEWKIDHENRLILRNGKPFFLHGVNLPSYGSNDTDNAMRAVREMGFNAILYMSTYTKWGGSGLDPTNTAYLYLAQKHDLLVMPWMESYGGKPPADAAYLDSSGGQNLVGLHFALIRDKQFANMSFSERTTFWEDAVARQMPRFLTAAATVKNHPNLLGYFIFDEPVPREKYDQISAGQKFYSKLHEVDGYHPVMVNYCHLPEGDEYVDWCDVLVVDPYWVPPGRPDRVSKFTAQAWRRAAPRRNPVWSVPCGELWSFIYKRGISPAENLCQTYLALIHGAKGLWFFSYPFKYQFTVDGFKNVNRHLEILGPMVVSPAVKQVVNAGKDNFNDIQAALFRNPAGGYVLIAANRCEYPVDAVFTLSNLGNQEQIRQLFDKTWSAVARDGSFQDKFEPFGVRAYTFQTARDTRHATRSTDQGLRTKDNVTTITIAMTPHPEAVTPEQTIPATGRPGKRNLVQNPGFEIPPTLPGIPDYYPMYYNPGSGLYFGQPDALASLDETAPFEGKYCFRLGAKGGNTFNSLAFRLAPQKDKPMQFVWSVYMRADRAGATASFIRNGAAFGDGGSVVLDTEWKRYHKVGEIGPGNAVAWQNTFQINIRPPKPGESCTVWIDALQVEQGTAPTEYEP